jgi:hypothetical protein
MSVFKPTSALQLVDKLKDVNGFIGVYASDILPEVGLSNFSLISNYDPSFKPGSHWIAIQAVRDYIYYFDSMGMPPDADDLILNDKTNFKEWINHHSFGRKFKYNHHQYQKLGTETCGEWAALFIKNKSLLPVFGDSNNPDLSVARWFNNVSQHDPRKVYL